MSSFEVTPIPFGGKRGKYCELREALKHLEHGQAIKLPKDIFGTGVAESALQMKRNCGKRARQKKSGDFLYVWLAE